MQNWKLIVVAAVLVVFGAVGVYPALANRYGLPAPQWLMDRQLKLGLISKGASTLSCGCRPTQRFASRPTSNRSGCARRSASRA
jgi:hypothetical protein